LSAAPSQHEPGRARPHISRGITIVLLAIIVLFFAALRWRLRATPLERDEGEYAYAGQLILHGAAPYAHLYSMKLPGTFVAYAVMLAIFGQSASGVHIGLLLVNAATILLIFAIARRLFGRLAALVAAASYGLLSTSPAVLGFAGHATHFVVLAAMAGTLTFLIAAERQRPWLLLFSGALFGLAFLMKQPGILFAVFGAIYLAYRYRQDLRGLIRALAVFGVGVVLPFAMTCVVLLAAGAFGNFWFWTFSYAHRYETALTLSEGWELFRLMLPQVAVPCIGIWIIAAVGLLWHRRQNTPTLSPSAGESMGRHSEPDGPAQRVFLWALAVCSAISVCAGLYFRAHYFILLLPALAILAGVGVSRATEWAWGRGMLVRSLPFAIFAVAVAPSLYSQRAYLFQADPIGASRMTYSGNAFPEAVEAAEYLRANTTPDDRIAVLGSEPEIYFYADRRGATGYIYTYGLMEDQPYALEMQKQMIAEIEAGRPQYIAFFKVATSFGRLPTSHKLIFEWMDRYLGADYRLVRTLPVEDSQESIKIYQRVAP
jgi:4-amino-4-deoxy-L-arabinose transferase-like glycosyltransferase